MIMICEMCGKNEATFHYSEIVNGKKTEHHLCGECAAKTDISYYSSLFEDGKIGQFLAGLLGHGFVQSSEKEDERMKVVCPNCGMSYGEFVKNSKFGCSECYNVFEPILDDSIKAIQGSVRHVGKKPVNTTDSKPSAKKGTGKKATTVNDKKAQLKKSIETYEMQIKAAIAEEDYMEAARLRDLIKDLKAGLKGEKGNE